MKATKRLVYLVFAVVLAGAAALLTLRAQHTVPVVVAIHDLRAGTLVAASDVQVVRMHDDSVPAGYLTASDQAAGRYVAWPLAANEPILGRQLAASRSGSADVGGLDVPAGFSAVAVPVQPAAAVGGMLSPGDRVDVFATTAQAAATDLPPSNADQLGHDILVIQLRSDQGQALQAPADSGTVHGLNFGSGKLGSVVLAVPTADASRYAVAVNSKVIYLALSVT